MKVTTSLIKVLICLVLTTALVHVRADPLIAGYVTMIRGDVQLASDVRRINLMLGQALTIGSKILTGPDARLQARMKDGTVLTLSERTEFVIVQVDDASPQSQGNNFELLKGAFRALTAQPEAGRSILPMRVRTPVAIIGVRGTDLWGGFDLLGSGQNTLDVVMLEGKGVYVENSAGVVELVKPGDGTTVRGAGAPSPLIPWGERKLKAAIDSVAW